MMTVNVSIAMSMTGNVYITKMMLRHLISKKKGISQYFNPTLYQRNDALPLYVKQMMLCHFIFILRDLFLWIILPLQFG